jgi:hypothetical protein
VPTVEVNVMSVCDCGLPNAKCGVCGNGFEQKESAARQIQVNSTRKAPPAIKRALSSLALGETPTPKKRLIAPPDSDDEMEPMDRLWLNIECSQISVVRLGSDVRYHSCLQYGKLLKHSNQARTHIARMLRGLTIL